MTGSILNAEFHLALQLCTVELRSHHRQETRVDIRSCTVT